MVHERVEVELLARLLQRFGLITSEELEGLRQAARPDTAVDFVREAVERGHVSPRDMAEVCAFMRRHLVICPACSRARRRAPGQTVCGACGAMLEAAAEAPPEQGVKTVRLAEAAGPGPAPARPGRRLGPYDLLELVGAGGMGVVYRVYDRQLGREVALKTIRGSLDQAQVRAFLHEGRTLASLRHPNIVSVHQAGWQDGRPYFTMELVRGCSLERLIREGRIGRRRGLELAVAIAGALHYAHERGVIHRDINPRNILVDERGEPQLADFGIASRADGRGADPGALGTPSYMSPEQAGLAPEQAAGPADRVDRRSDVYALGCVVYEMLTGRRPFQMAPGESVHDLIGKVMTTDPVRPRALDPTIEPDAEAIVLRAMDKDPDRRYPTAREMKEDLLRLLAGDPVRARPRGPLERALRTIRRHMRAVGLLAALGALGLAAR